MYLVEPTFSEYAAACERAELQVRRIWGGIEHDDVCPISKTGIPVTTKCDQLSPLAKSLLTELTDAPTNAAVFLTNPGNPSGQFLPTKDCLALLQARPDLLWVLDEAFIEYVGPEDEMSPLPRLRNGGRMQANAVFLRSLTKFYGLPGIRMGFLVTMPELARAVQEELPVWNVNCFAMAAILAVLQGGQAQKAYAEQARTENRANRAHLAARLQTLPHMEVFPSQANYVLFRWTNAPVQLNRLLLQGHGIALRDCSNYFGLEDGTYFRAAVRTPAEHERLVAALASVAPDVPAPVKGDHLRSSDEGSCLSVSNEDYSKLHKCRDDAYSKVHDRARDRSATKTGGKRTGATFRTPALMLQGTSSDAGKSILAAAFCRIFQQDGFDVAPFKAQNMSLNSGVTARGDEMGRAQIVQAMAARIDPDARMNPVLLKPASDTGSQVIVLGQPIGNLRVLEYFRKKKELWGTVTAAYDSLAAEHDIMVLEGAGSPGEVNLKSHDIVNMRMAAHAHSPVLLVGDIDRGGVYASFLGTWLTFTPPERQLLAGYLVNRFRGDASLLADAHTYMLEHTGVPVLGTIPYIHDLNIPEEDMAGFPWGRKLREKGPDTLDVAVVMLHHVSNFTDFLPLAAEPDIAFRTIRTAEEWGEPDLIVLPGSKSVAADLAELQRSGLAEKILAHGRADKWILGICGGLQILGRSIIDPAGIESASRETPGLGLLDLASTFAEDKTLVRIARAETPLGVPTHGYEIHHAHTANGPSARPLFLRCGEHWQTEAERACGYVCGRRWTTYLHGMFDDDTFRRAFIDHVREDLGLPRKGAILAHYDIDAAIDRLADTVRENTDMDAIYNIMGLQ